MFLDFRTADSSAVSDLPVITIAAAVNAVFRAAVRGFSVRTFIARPTNSLSERLHPQCGPCWSMIARVLFDADPSINAGIN